MRRKGPTSIALQILMDILSQNDKGFSVSTDAVMQWTSGVRNENCLRILAMICNFLVKATNRESCGSQKIWLKRILMNLSVKYAVHVATHTT